MLKERATFFSYGEKCLAILSLTGPQGSPLMVLLLF